MKLTITIEEESKGEVRIERPGVGPAVVPAEERPTEPAAMNAGGPPEWLLAGLQQGPPEQMAGEASDVIDAGPAPRSTNGVAAMRI
jgi:hypothetical protein